MCSGTGCARSISVSRFPWGNPVALKDPEHWAVRYMECPICLKDYCDKCALNMKGKCQCGGALYWKGARAPSPDEAAPADPAMIAKYVEFVDGCPVVKFPARAAVSNPSMTQLEKTMMGLVFHGKSKKIVVDLAQTKFIDSANIGILMTVLSGCLWQGVVLALAKPDKKIMDLFSIMGMQKMFPIFDSVEAAVKNQ